MDLKEKLIQWIQEAVGGCATYWAGLIAEHLIGKGVVVPVRCRECRFCEACSIKEAGGFDDNGFCSYGKRRDFNN